MEKFTRLLKKYNVSFNRLIDLVQDDIKMTNDFMSVYAALHVLDTEIVCFAVVMYDGGGTFKSTHQNYTYEGLENILARN